MHRPDNDRTAPDAREHGMPTPSDALHVVHARICELLACAWDELQLLHTPEGLVELRLRRLLEQTTPNNATRIGSAQELLAWASAVNTGGARR